jgi:hypothetical protein
MKTGMAVVLVEDQTGMVPPMAALCTRIGMAGPHERLTTRTGMEPP